MAGRLVMVCDADGGRTGYSYDDRALLLQYQRPIGITFYFRYDETGRCVETWGEYPGGSDPCLAGELPKRLSDSSIVARGVHHAVLEQRGLSKEEAARLVRCLEMLPRPWAELSALSALEVSSALGGNDELLAHANRLAPDALRQGAARTLLPFAEQLGTLAIEDWVAGVLALQEMPTHEAFNAYSRLQIPAGWNAAAKLAEGLLVECEAIANPTLRLLAFRSIMPSLTTAVRSGVRLRALSLWQDHAHEGS